MKNSINTNIIHSVSRYENASKWLRQIVKIIKKKTRPKNDNGSSYSRENISSVTSAVAVSGRLTGEMAKIRIWKLRRTQLDFDFRVNAPGLQNLNGTKIFRGTKRYVLLVVNANITEIYEINYIRHFFFKPLGYFSNRNDSRPPERRGIFELNFTLLAFTLTPKSSEYPLAVLFVIVFFPRLISNALYTYHSNNTRYCVRTFVVVFLIAVVVVMFARTASEFVYFAGKCDRIQFRRENTKYPRRPKRR